jgi:hypothetical protein
MRKRFWFRSYPLRVLAGERSVPMPIKLKARSYRPGFKEIQAMPRFFKRRALEKGTAFDTSH